MEIQRPFIDGFVRIASVILNGSTCLDPVSPNPAGFSLFNVEISANELPFYFQNDHEDLMV